LWWFWSNYVAANNINSLPEYQNEHGLAYWQWANSTYSYMTNSVQSWAQMGGLVTSTQFPGTMEMKFFQSYPLQTYTNTANYAIFSAVNMYSTSMAAGTNYEYLFLTYNLTEGEGSEPPSNSLFNVANMQMLVELGESTPNIMTNSSEIYNVTFALGAGWQTLTTTLGFETQEQTYLLWLWLAYAQ
jgi:hypothetical protein